MTIQRGLMIGGKVVPDTDYVIRDWPRAQFDPPDTFVRKSPLVNLIVYHWTGGQPFVGPNSGAKAARNCEARVNKAGKLAKVGYHLLTCWDGLIFQMADLALGTWHVGHRETAQRSIGWEHAFPGTLSQARRLGVDITGSRSVSVDGHVITVVIPTVEMMRATAKLSEVIVNLDPSYGLSIPRRVPVDDRGNALRDRFTDLELGAWVGGMEHFHIEPTEQAKAEGVIKYDGAGLFIENQLGAGWKGVRP